MELFFLFLLLVLMAAALGSGYPVAFALPGSAILSIVLAAIAGWLFAGNPDAYFAQGGPWQWLSAGVTNLRGVYWEVERDTLIAIPLFVFMGIMLQRSKIAEDLLVTMAQLFGAIPGGLGVSVVFVGALLAATTGILGATVVAMGLISLPVMMRNNYSHSLATGTIAASGTLGQIIPPSIVLIILADQLSSAVDQADTARKNLHKVSTGELSMPSEFAVTSTSAGDMFMGAFIPGLILVGLYIVYILVVALLRPQLAPAVPVEGGVSRQLLTKAMVTLVPPLTLIFVVLGSIIGGIATVNQAGAIGAVGAMIMAGYRLMDGRRGAFWPAFLAIGSLIVILTSLRVHPINIKNIATSADVTWLIFVTIAVMLFIVALVWSGWRTLKIDNTLHSVMVDTAKTTSLVFIILLGAAMLTAAFRAFGGEELVREFLTSLPGGFWGQFIIVMAVIFLLGFFLDFIEIAVVVVPIVAPILLADPSANVTAVWLGVMIGLNIQTSFLTPPFGFALFYLRGVAPAAVKTLSIYKGVIAFIALQLVALGIVGWLPSLVNYLPTRLSLLSETAPPPVNPRLQYCIEQHVFTRFENEGGAIRSAIGKAKALDVSYLPDRQSKDFAAALEKAESVFPLLDDVKSAQDTLEAAKPAYRPLHTQVREIERDVRKLDKHLEELSVTLSRARGDEAEARRTALKAEIKKLEGEKTALLANIPGGWDDARKAFGEKLRADKIARQKYRRAGDDAYQPVVKLIDIIGGLDALRQTEQSVTGLRDILNSASPTQASDAMKAVAAEVGRVEGAGPVRSAINKARRELRGSNPKVEEAKTKLEDAIALFKADVVWRERAQTDLAPQLKDYEAAIRDSIGLRSQRRLPKEIALEVASCQSHHRDISLQF